MAIFLRLDDWNDQYVSPADYVSTHEPMDGDEFTLVKAAVYTATTYRMVDGKPVPATLHIGAELPAV